MKPGYLQVVPIKEAKEKFLELAKAAPKRTERVTLDNACGRVLAQPVRAHISAPHFYASAMDGVAMRARDGFGASETTPVVLKDFEVVDTGDPIPEDYDCVVMVEDVVEEDGVYKITSAPAPWQHIRQIGEDICQGEMAFPSYTKLTPAALGALASCGILSVEVLARPKVGIIPTGDEIVPRSDCPGKGDLMEFNSLIFSGMLREWGAEPSTYPIVPDDPEQLTAMLKKAVSEQDLVLVLAGSSKGRGDFAHLVLDTVGKVIQHGIAARPGKPAILGHAGTTPVVGLPGYPVSGVVVLNEIVQPAIKSWTHDPGPDPITLQATLGRKVVSPLKYEEFVRCRVGHVGGKWVATPLGSGSSVVSTFAKADGILRIPQNTEGLEAGQEVTLELLRPISYLKNTVSVVGSHDPLFDEIADILEQKGDAHLASSHAGSMGGIMAIRRGEAHLGGIHLLDSDTGRYNCSYLKKYFPKGGVRLMKGVGRQQGLMVAPGNPKGIARIQDLPELRYVNRQRGAGTRVLLDYLLAKEGIDPTSIYGYEREEMTHLAVAVQIASGSADAGMGVYSAAAAFGLGFVPIYLERYDLLMTEEFVQSPLFPAFYEAFTGPELKERLTALGGYTLEGMGEWISWEDEV